MLYYNPAQNYFSEREVYDIPVFGNHFRDDDDDRNLKVWIHRLMKAIRVAICSSALVTPKSKFEVDFIASLDRSCQFPATY
jgi:hypothetical protein